MEIVRSLAHKMGEFGALMKTKQNCWELCTMCFHQTWLIEQTVHFNASLPSFKRKTANRAARFKEEGLQSLITTHSETLDMLLSWRVSSPPYRELLAVSFYVKRVHTRYPALPAF